MQSRKPHSPRWLTYIDAIAYSCSNENSDFSQSKNDLTLSLMGDCARCLIKGDALSAAQAKALINNIRIRVKHKAEFDWPYPIQLTQKQVQDAKHNPKFEWMFEYNKIKVGNEAEARKAFYKAIELCQGNITDLEALADHISQFKKEDS